MMSQPIFFKFDPTAEGAFVELQKKNVECSKKLGVPSISNSFLKDIFETSLSFKSGAFPGFSGFTCRGQYGKAVMSFNF